MAVNSPQQDDEVSRHVYPPDAWFKEHLGISLTRLFIALAFIATVVEIVRVGTVDTPIPYNYPLYAGFAYIVAAILITRRFHTIFDTTKIELVDILQRTSADNAVFERGSDITPEELADDVDSIMNLAFHPAVVFVGGIVGGIFALLVMWLLDVFSAYPYVLLDYAYGAGHGFYYGPIIGAVYFIYKVPEEYIVDIDMLDPDGVGGYQQIGDAIISLITYGVFLVTLDFIILSSATFIGRPVFTTAVFGLYGLMLLFLLSLTVFGVISIRSKLLDIREQKSNLMREQFQEIEERYWRKLNEGENPSPESEHIETMDTMFNRLHSMELWPINLASLSRLAFSVGSSGVIAAYKAGFIPLPI